MSINWITVAAQIANFLLLVWLLKRFLYRPVLDGIDAREAEISNRMQEAAKAKEKAVATEAEYHAQVRALNVAQSEMTEAVRKQAEEQRDTLLAEAHKRMEQERASWRSHLDEEARKYTLRLHRAGAEALLSLTRKALIDLADETLEERIARHLVQQSKSIAADLKRAAGEATVASVSSRDPLAPAIRDELTAKLETLFPQVTVKFDADTKHATGIVLRIGGAQLAWTLDSYIDGLGALIGERLASGSGLKAQVP